MAFVLQGVTATLDSVFLRPLGLAAIAAIVPIVVLYLLKPDPTRIEFPAVEFLLSQRDRRREYPALGRLVRNALLAIQLLAVLVLAVSLATPYVSVAEESTRTETVLVVDTSASMATADAGTTRFDRAIRAANEEVTAQTSIVTTEPTSSVVLRRAPAPEARARLSSLGVTDARGDLVTAIEQASALAGENARLVVVSDFATAGWRTAVETARARGLSVSLQQFARGGERNVGLVDRSFANGEVTVSVRNFGGEPATPTLELGETTQSLELGPGDTASATLDVPARGGTLRLRSGDSFRTDDTMPIAAPEDTTIDVLVLSNAEQRPLRTALSVIGATDVTVREPPATITDSYDVVVFGDIEPTRVLDGTRNVARETVDDGGLVVIQAHPRLSESEYGGLLPLEPTGTGETPSVRQPAAGPLTTGITFPAPSRYTRGELHAGRSLVRTANGTPLLATAPVGDGTVLYYGYHPAEAAFEQSYQYPVFWKRALYESTGRRSLDAMNRPTGTVLQLGDETTVEGPTRTTETRVATLDRVGAYQVGQRSYATALVDPIESNVTAPSITRTATGSENTTGDETRTVPFDLTPGAVALVGCLMFLEVGYLRYRGDL